MSPVRLMVLTPTAGARVSNGYCDSFARLAVLCKERGVRLEREISSEPGHLVHARNVLFAAACDSDATHALWWDADVAFDPEHVFPLLDRPEGAISRTYPARDPAWEKVADWVRDGGVVSPNAILDASIAWVGRLQFVEGRPHRSKDGKLVELEHDGMGCVLMKTALMREFDMPRCKGTDWRARRYVPAFDLIHAEGGAGDGYPLCGEDVSFWKRWRQRIGGGLWCAPDACVVNGNRAGVFAHYLDAQFPVPELSCVSGGV